jgi:iron complex outermembrane receptor protein
MLKIKSPLRVGTAAVAIVVGLAAAPAMAQEALPQDSSATPQAEADAGDIVITGSRIQRRDASALGPLSTLTDQDIAFAAPTSAGDLLQTLPSVGVSLNSNGTQGTSFGVSSINLRYLGSSEGSGNRTLVLVDGHRWVNAVGGRGFRDFVDLNTIPLGMIDKIEVLKDGASAIYGADAIAGVVNIQTKRNLNGLEASARMGVSDRGDGAGYSGYVNWGVKRDRFNTFLSLSYSKSNPVRTDARKLTEFALAPLTAAPSSPYGLYVLPGLANNAYFGTPAGFANNAANAITRNRDAFQIGSGASADNSYHLARLPGDYYNTQAQGVYAIGPSERIGAFGRIGFDISDSVEFKVEGLYNRRESSQLFSPVLMDVRGSNGFSVSADQLYNPFGTANGVPGANALAFSGNTFRIQRVALEVGNRDNVQVVETWRVAAGLDGRFNLGSEWRWDAFFSVSQNSATFDAYNQINYENVYRALRSPAACAAAAGCVPLNLFGVITPQQADYIRYNGHDEQKARQYDFTANVSGNLFNLPGGPLGIAAGYEFRREEATDLPDVFANTISTVLPLVGGVGQSPTTAQARDATTGSYELHEFYGEISAPLLADLPGIYRLDLEAAARYSSYSTSGDKVTGKFGIAYRPIRDVLLRGTYSQGFRAPSILELYQGKRMTNFQAVDPCNGGGAGLPGCAGVPTGYNQNLYGAGTVQGVVSGNENLRPETADTFSAGIAITPAAVNGLTLTVDWFRIKVKDAISSQTPTQILLACASRAAFCDLIDRDAATGEVLELRQAVVNLSSIEVSGIDASARYRFGTGIGTFEAVVDASYLDRYRTEIPQADGSVVVDDRAGKADQPRSTFPRWKGQASLRYFNDAISAGWKTRYIGSSTDVPNNAINGGKIKAIFYHDVQGTLSVGEAYSFTLGMDNVFDQQPPASAANNPINFDMYTYDIRGRYVYARVGVKV